MSKANKKDTRMTPLTSLWCLHHQLRPYPTPTPMPRFRPREGIVHWAIKISRESTPKLKLTEVCQEPNEQKIIGSQQIRIIIFIIKNHYFIFRSSQTNFWIHLRSSWVFEDLHPLHKEEFSMLLKNRKCIKITANINN